MDINVGMYVAVRVIIDIFSWMRIPSFKKEVWHEFFIDKETQEETRCTMELSFVGKKVYGHFTKLCRMSSGAFENRGKHLLIHGEKKEGYYYLCLYHSMNEIAKNGSFTLQTKSNDHSEIRLEGIEVWYENGEKEEGEVYFYKNSDVASAEHSKRQA